MVIADEYNDMIRVGNIIREPSKVVGPKTGLMKAVVEAINPDRAHLEELFGREMPTPEYLSQTTEGEDRVLIECYLREIKSGEIYKHSFYIVEKLRQAKRLVTITDPISGGKKEVPNFQWVNNAGRLVYGTSREDLEWRAGPDGPPGPKWRFEAFVSRPYRHAMVGEENLYDLLDALVLQGANPEPEDILEPDMKRIFKGDFGELQEIVEVMKAQPSKGMVTALATIGENKGAEYQSLWKSLAAPWVYTQIKKGDTKGAIGKWLDEIQGQYGSTDKYDLSVFLSD